MRMVISLSLLLLSAATLAARTPRVVVLDMLLETGWPGEVGV